MTRTLLILMMVAMAGCQDQPRKFKGFTIYGAKPKMDEIQISTSQVFIATSSRR